MIAKDYFASNDSLSNWLMYSGASNKSMGITNGKLRFTNGSGSFGTVLYNPKLDKSLDVTIDLTLIQNISGDGYIDCGVYLFDSQLQNFIYISSFSNNRFGYEVLTGGISGRKSTGKSEVIANKGIDVNQTMTIRITSDDMRKAKIYRNAELLFTVDLGFTISQFGLHNYGAIIDYDNFIINSKIAGIGGNSKQDDGKISRFVLIDNWDTGKRIAKIVPDGSGFWSIPLETNVKVIVTHIGEDGYRPKSDAPIIPVPIE